MEVEAIFLVILFAIMMVVWGTLAKNSLGFNLKNLHCPRCIRPISRGRGLTRLWRLLAGGASCSECLTVMDKWGRERLPGEKDRKCMRRAEQDKEQISR